MEWLGILLWIVGGAVALLVAIFAFFFVNALMGKHSLTNRWAHQNMSAEAERVVSWITKRYQESRLAHPGATESEIIEAILFKPEALSKASEDFRARVAILCQSINGISYLLGLEETFMKRHVVSRCIQFTFYIDRALEAKGFPKITRKEKQPLMVAMDIAPEGWESWTPEGSRFPMMDEDAVEEPARV